MLRAVDQGESDPAVLAELAKGRAKGRLREKLPALRLRQARTGRIQPHQRLLVGALLDHITYLEQARRSIASR